MKNTNKNFYSHGFTLLELMITVAIIGILSAIAIPAYNGYITTAKMTEAHNNLAALRMAEEEYFLENRSYFMGTSTNNVATNSSGYWSPTKGSNGSINFSYVVSSAAGWTATATSSTLGSVTITK